MTKPFIDFYNSIGFAPTGQEPALKIEHKKIEITCIVS